MTPRRNETPASPAFVLVLLVLAFLLVGSVAWLMWPMLTLSGRPGP